MAKRGGRYKNTPLAKRAYPHYRYKDLLAAIGSDKDIQKLIVGYGFEAPTEPVIRGWRVRNSIPSRWLPLLIHKGMQDGFVPSMTVLLETPF